MSVSLVLPLSQKKPQFFQRSTDPCQWGKEVPGNITAVLQPDLITDKLFCSYRGNNLPIFGVRYNNYKLRGFKMLWIISLINLTQGFPSMIIQPMTKYICAIFVTACPLYSMHRPIYNILHLLINSCFHLSAFRGIFIREKVLEKHNSS